MVLTLVAWGPFAPSPSSNVTFAPSWRVRKPSPAMPEKCTNASLPPSSGVMKPKPFSSENHLTTPVATIWRLLRRMLRCARRCCRHVPSRIAPARPPRRRASFTSPGCAAISPLAGGAVAAVGRRLGPGRLLGRRLVEVGVEAAPAGPALLAVLTGAVLRAAVAVLVAAACARRVDAVAQAV